jgi:hypothetical protein
MMGGRPRLPEAVAKATGAMLKDPQNFRNRKPPKSKPLGKPPKGLSLREIEAWNLFADEIPWLEASDRMILEGACRIRAKIMEGEFSVSMMTELRQILNAMGATPAARSKVTARDDDTGDPLDDFLN